MKGDYTMGCSIVQTLAVIGIARLLFEIFVF